MKLRIDNNNMRFRIDGEGLLNLSRQQHLQCQTKIPQQDGAIALFEYDVVVDPAATAADIRIAPFGIHLILSPADFAQLNDPARESVSFQREWKNETGQMDSLKVCLEKDRMQRRKPAEGYKKTGKLPSSETEITR